MAENKAIVITSSTTREELEAIKSRELAKVATANGIKGAHDRKKAEIIDLLMEVVRDLQAKEIPVTATSPVTEVIKEAQETTPVFNNMVGNWEKKMEYIENVAIGTMVAFQLPNGKVKSAKVINKSTARRMLKLETSYGKQFIITYEQVLWVRTGNRWPKGIYELFKNGVQ